MTITSKEVKTFYSIRINWMDICKIAEKHKIGFAFRSLEEEHPDASKWCRADVNALLKQISTPSMLTSIEEGRHNNTTLEYIVYLLGFDGISNYGTWQDKYDAICLSVYNYGADEIRQR